MSHFIYNPYDFSKSECAYGVDCVSSREKSKKYEDFLINMKNDEVTKTVSLDLHTK